MPKNIIICADGTGNTTIRGRGTNVFKLYEAVDQNAHRFDSTAVQQIAIYHDGVGTESLKWLRIFGGVFGWGLSRNVKQLYGELARVYDRDDRIFLFGFSRGAFTVRTLAGLVTSCGILDPTRYPTNYGFWRAVRQAYGHYRRKYQTVLSRLVRGTIAIDDELFRRRFSVGIEAFADPERKLIEFIGVWDTVDAVGSPFGIADLINGTMYRFKFPNTTLSPEVARACHALALDEPRQSFEPVLWEEQPGDEERIDQVWFAGSHSNVGGGYPRQGMSLVTLDWMMRNAEAHGLRFLPQPRLMYRDGTDVDDKLYDPRAGLGIFYRWRPRNVAASCRENNIAPKVHRTVFQRIARNTEGYAPGSVPPDSEVVTSSSPEICAAITQFVASQHADGRSLLERERRAHIYGVTAYWLMILTSLTCLALILGTYYADMQAIDGWRNRTLAMIHTIISTNWIAVTARTIWHYPWLIAAALLALFINLRVDRHLDASYSEFWHRLRAPLRELLQKRPPSR
jgi:uncharacterized protein (DUF2235 family)